MKPWRRLTQPRFLVVYPLVVGLFVTARQTTALQWWAGFGLVCLGEALRWWANGYVGHVKVNWTAPRAAKIGSFVTAGPYAYVRHPLYLGSGLLGCGFVVLAGNGWLALGALLMFLVVYSRQMTAEEQTLHNEWSDAFLRYRRAVPRWWPTWRRYPERHGQWSWQGIAASKEWKTLVWVLVMLILFNWWQQRTLPWATHQPKDTLLLAALAGLVAADGAFELMRRMKRRAVAPQILRSE